MYVPSKSKVYFVGDVGNVDDSTVVVPVCLTLYDESKIFAVIEPDGEATLASQKDIDFIFSPPPLASAVFK